jgi:lysozyme
MNKPKLKLVDAINIIPADHWHKLRDVTYNFFGVFLMGLRGYYQDTMGKPGVNDRGIYDDAICIIDRGGILIPFNGNTDPSRFRQSIATLIPGVHMYRKGKHGITTHTDGGYPAFRPATPDESLPVWRDGTVPHSVHKGIAINIHKGGYGTTSSEGCQTIYPDQWLDFQQTAYELMDKYGQKTIPYILADWKQ